jgi:subtilisin family serine protease
VYPALYGQVLGVSGVRPDKSFASSSPCEYVFGGSTFSNQGIHVDVAGPFWGMTTAPGDTYEDESDGWCGNSFATPHVAATAALIRAHKPALHNYKIYDRIMGTAEDLGSSGWDAQYGEGLLNTHAALGPWSNIDGSQTAGLYQTCVWSENVAGGYGSVSYKWYKNAALVSTNSYYWTDVGSSSFWLKLEVTDSHNFTHEKSIFVQVSPGGDCEA